jgi:hypothetical protein
LLSAIDLGSEMHWLQAIPGIAVYACSPGIAVRFADCGLMPKATLSANAHSLSATLTQNTSDNADANDRYHSVAGTLDKLK